MDAREALELVDRLTYVKTGEHFNDVERDVFVGSWQGKTYEEIAPKRASYLEKYVGYRLWKKLSQVLGEKVGKKGIQGAVARWLERRRNVVIDHCNQALDRELAKQLSEVIHQAGHRVFTINVDDGFARDSLSERNWPSRIETELQQCDYFILLLSPPAAVSEMVAETLRQAKVLCDADRNSKPILLTVRINYSLGSPLSHDLRNYLQGTQHRELRSSTDIPLIQQEVLTLLEDRDGGQVENWEEWYDGNLESWEENLNQPPHLSSSNTQIPSPLPVAEPELPNGRVHVDSAFYVERVPNEAQCYREILRPGALIRIKAPRQMGKTSLMARILARAKEQGYRTVNLSFQHADESIFASLSQLLQWFCARVARKLSLSYQISDHWTDTYGSKDNCTIYFEDHLLSQAENPLVLGLDEVDRVFQHPSIADDFFGLLRAWYEEAGYGHGGGHSWEKLRLIVVHSTEVYIPLDINQSPFNVGMPIELLEFDLDQVYYLAQRHGLDWQMPQVHQLMQIVGGHPYLVRLALYHIAQKQLTLQQLPEIAPTEAGIYGDHLRRHLWNLQKHPELATALSQVVTMDQPVELASILAFKLHSLGLVHLHGNGVTPRFELYRQYFCDRLGTHAKASL
ncbi:MAG: TIR domain-containing protein [Cyanothece sp. SIO1E1]|nr:TIR domain-containing protein [Cyanothece sp. SIO1E1]